MKVFDTIQYIYPGGDREGYILKIYPSGKLLVSDEYPNELGWGDCNTVIIDDSDVIEVIEPELPTEHVESALSIMIKAMEKVMPIDNWCLAAIGMQWIRVLWYAVSKLLLHS